ncbi:unnamed protein product [Symbiodinium microadriaticum]|nr:unnamed protein product [Symbiodinium microadriaticum]
MGTRNKYDTPTYGILLSASGILVLCWLSFSEVIEMLNILYCIAQLIEFAAFIQLRVSYPDMKRPFKIPLGTVGVSLMLALPTLFVLIIVGISSTWAVICAFGLAILGFFVALGLQQAEERGLWVFENIYEKSCPSLTHHGDLSIPDIADAFRRDVEESDSSEQHFSPGSTLAGPQTTEKATEFTPLLQLPPR